MEKFYYHEEPIFGTASYDKLHLRGDAMVSAAMKDLQSPIALLKNCKYDLKTAIDKPLGEVDDDTMTRLKDATLDAMKKYDDQVKIAKRSIPKPSKPKAASKAVPKATA